MKKHLLLCAAATIAVGASLSWADPSPVLQPSDPILAFDSDPGATSSSYPGAESPPKLIDGIFNGSSPTKYLNFGREGSGFIVIPDSPSVIQSFQLYTANDDDRRDPASYKLFGTNSAIVSADNSAGTSEPWTLISSGPLTLPAGNAGRLQPGTPVDIAGNAVSYSAYKMFFPTLRSPTGGGCCMQLGEAQFYTGTGLGGSAILAPSNNIRAIDDPLGSQSSYPAGEEPNKAIDQISAPPPGVSTKYLNFGRENAGLIVTPGIHAVIDGIQFTTANDSPERDPVLIALYGTNDPITDGDNSTGTGENWTLIVDNLGYAAPTDRYAAGPLVTFPNAHIWLSYKIVILDNRGPDSVANSIQFAEVQLFSGSVPEPATVALVFAGLAGLALRRRPR